jgi:hypothetical protein
MEIKENLAILKLGRHPHPFGRDDSSQGAIYLQQSSATTGMSYACKKWKDQFMTDACNYRKTGGKIICRLRISKTIFERFSAPAETLT